MKKTLEFTSEILTKAGFVLGLITFFYGYWDMFQYSENIGSFAWYFPFIGHIIWLFMTGFTSLYAFAVYTTVALIALAYLISRLTENK